MIERLSQFIQSQHLSVRAFEASISASDGMIRRAINNNSDIQSKWLSTIADNYPNLSLDWLITGRGSMLRSDQLQSVSQSVAQSVAPQDLLLGEAAAYYRMYKEEKEEKETLLKENGRLEERLRQLEPRENIPGHPSISNQIAEAFTSEPSGGFIKDSIHTRKPTTTLGKSSAGKT